MAVVFIPACAPLNDKASTPLLCKAMDNNALDTISPVESNASYSRPDGRSVISDTIATSSSVVSPIAETTTTADTPAAQACDICSAARSI